MKIPQQNGKDNAINRHSRSLRPSLFGRLVVAVLLHAVATGITVAAAAASATDGSFSAGPNTHTHIHSTSIPFGYSEDDLTACVRELESARDSTDEPNPDSNSNACLLLYRNFLDHYHRGDNDKRGEFVSSLSSSSSSFPAGYVHFTKTVRLVHQHNQHYPHDVRHKLRLNQFADRPHSYSKRENEEQDNDDWQVDLENFWKDRFNEEEDQTGDKMEEDNEIANRRSRKLRWKGTDVRLLGNPSSIRAEKNHQRQQRQGQQHQQQQQRQGKQRLRQSQQQPGEEEPLSSRSLLSEFHTPLSSDLRIIAGSKHNTKVIMPGDGTIEPPRFSSPQVPEIVMGTEVELHKGTSTDASRSMPLVKESINDVDPPHHRFSKSLDWSTEHNPDGVPLVHGAFDQGSCGSCWAFAATGSIETSAARNFARNHFVSGLLEIDQELLNIYAGKADNDDYGFDDDNIGRQGKYHTLLEDLINESMRIERQVFEELTLSIQELLDCDVSVNEGCVGGNPLLAFFYIHKHGLVPWEEYPYEGYGKGTENSHTTTTTTRLGYIDDTFPTLITFPGKTNRVPSSNLIDPDFLFEREEAEGTGQLPSCRKDKIGNPIATVESWGLLHKNHEDLIEYALLYVGPVAVGIYGADPAFINYGGGIFDSADCDQTANHALLIVGYDQEDVTNENGDVETIRYWIARNSWGEGWGENGFARIKRGPGGKGVPGVCGIARSPSVALGGLYRQNRTEPLKNKDKLKTTSRYRKGKYVVSYDTTASRNGQNERNHPSCHSMFNGKSDYLNAGCERFSIIYERYQSMFLALICMLIALIAIIPLGVSLRRQHRVAVGHCSIRLDRSADHDSLSVRSGSSSRGMLSERTHLLTLKDMYADQRKQEEETKRPRGRSIVITSPEQDPFRLEPSSTFDYPSDDETKPPCSTENFSSLK